MNTKRQPTSEEFMPVLQMLNSFHPVGKGVAQYLLKNAYCQNLPKGKYLLRNGEICENIYFIKKGLLRGFIQEEDRETTIWFAAENEMTATIRSFLLQIATLFQSIKTSPPPLICIP